MTYIAEFQNRKAREAIEAVQAGLVDWIVMASLAPRALRGLDGDLCNQLMRELSEKEDPDDAA